MQNNSDKSPSYQSAILHLERPGNFPNVTVVKDNQALSTKARSKDRNMNDRESQSAVVGVLTEIARNLEGLTKYVNELAISVAANRGAIKGVADVVDENEEIAQDEKERERMKDVFTHGFLKSQNYLKVIIFGIYGTYFGLYGIVSTTVSDQRLLHSALLMITSVSVLVLFEVIQSVSTNWDLFRWLTKLETAVHLTQVGDELDSSEKAALRRLRYAWIVTLIVSLATALFAVGLFMSVLITALMSELPG